MTTNTNAYTIEEFIDLVQDELTVSCALDRILPDREVRRITEVKATPWFWRNYDEAQQLAYYFVDKKAFETDQYTNYKHIVLPSEVQYIKWVYGIKGGGNFFDYGFGLVGNGLSGFGIGAGPGQPFSSPNLTGIGDASTYISVLGAFGDQLGAMQKTTYKSDFNPNSKRFNVLTEVKTNLILETTVGIPAEHLYADPLFLEWVTGAAMVQLANQLGRFTMPQPGQAVVNHEGLRTEGEARKKAVEDKIAGMSASAWFYMVKR